jgi:DNA repair photolyase
VRLGLSYNGAVITTRSIMLAAVVLLILLLAVFILGTSVTTTGSSRRQIEGRAPTPLSCEQLIEDALDKYGGRSHEPGIGGFIECPNHASPSN